MDQDGECWNSTQRKILSYFSHSGSLRWDKVNETLVNGYELGEVQICCWEMRGVGLDEESAKRLKF